MNEKTYSTQEIADLLGVSKNTIMRAIAAGRLQAFAKTSPALEKKKASYYRISEAQLQAFIHRKQPQPQAS